MSSHKVLNRVISILMVLSMLLNGTIGVIQVSAEAESKPVIADSTSAMPAGPTDESKVPHYFGPWPNWANSPLTLPNATVTIQGDGNGAEAIAQVNSLTQGIDSIQIVSPGSGYTYANVIIGGGNSDATATATVNTSGVVTSVNVSAAGGGYTSPQVSFSGGGAGGTVVSVGNSLVARANATDFYTPPAVVPASVTPVDTVTFNVGIGSATGGTFTLTVDAATTAAINWNAAAADVQTELLNASISATVTGSGSTADPWVIVFATAPTAVTIDAANLTQPAAPALVPVFAIIPAAMPASGVVQKIQYFNQATPGGSPSASAGNKFHAYILQPSGVTNEYNVIWDSGELTVPATSDPVGIMVNIPVMPGVAVTTGDVIAFYGAGIPYDVTTSGADILSSPAPTPPSQGGTITLGSAGFPLVAEARTYSLGAQVLDQGVIPPVTSATGTAYGGVDAVAVLDGGSGYTMPTVDFDLPDDPNGVIAKAHAVMDGNGVITEVIVDDPGSGYLTAPGVVIHDGTLFDPIAGATPATASSTLKVTSVTVDTFGSGYISAPTVTFSDLNGTGSGASATASVDVGGVTSISVLNAGSGYLDVGIRKFIDDLPGMCLPPNCPTTGKYIPLAVPEAKMYNGIEADEYVIGVVQYRTSFSSDLPPTLVRGYVQLETTANAGISQHYPLRNEMLDGTFQDTGYFAVTPPQWLGPIVAATKNKPVRIVFRNLLPTGADGDLFLPVDSSMMGSGMGPMMMMDPMNGRSVMDEVRNPPCTDYPKGMGCFKDNRATLHLHGGITPWISDGTAHQWITPVGEMTDWPQGVSVSDVPDMDVCKANDDGCQTFYYTNQQSARLLFYHDHSWGITRLNVYAGEAAGYLISDPTEQALVANGTIPADQIPLIVQDRTFVPDAAQLALQDPTWDTARWGSKGSFWYHHVYMPAQNPGDPSGMSAYGRWMYGPWFWPPAATTVYGPIDNPYYDSNCNIDDPATWQYQTDPFCEPEKIPGTPNISVGMEQFNDTPIVNGVAYPKVTLEPKAYRLRILNAANDRFFNFQWYVADPTQGSGLTEVALKPAELEAAQTDPNVFPTPNTGLSPAGPSWIQIGTEGGFLPAPVVVPNQPITWITDPTRFDVGNVDQHSLLLAPAERADVIVDFSKYAGKTLILYNDAPAAFPARVASYDYYTGAPDLSPVGAPTILPGYGPNTRTIMQVTIAGTAAPAFNLTKLRNAFRHNANGTGVFESGQHPIIVGQAAYNSAYGTSFAASSNCNAPNSTSQRCDGLVRVDDTSTFGFNTLRAPNTKLTLPVQPKAIHDEMNASTFDEYGRMTANLGVEAQPPTPGQQNVTLYPFVNPATELIDATNLPKNDVFYDANGLPVSDIKITAIANATDGTQIWRITHNGVDTHPIHFHLYDVQLINRVTWDNIIIPPDLTELGWKDTVRVSPLEDTIFAIRPIIPEIPFEIPNAIRMLNPMMPEGSTAMFNNVNPQGIPTANIVNQLVNFGWEYVYHCHILSHEEMDMMRPVSVTLPPIKPDRLEFSINGSNLTLTWWDNSITETAFQVQRTTTSNGWQTIATIASPLGQPNIHEQRSYTDTTFNPSAAYQYRVVALNTVGYGGAYPSLTAQSVSDPIAIGTPLPPVVTSSVRQNPNPTNLSTVNFLVTFSESVTGVDAADFALSVSGGIAGHSITSVNPTDATGATYTVAVNTGTGDGTIRLDVIDDNSILSGFSIPLGGDAIGDGDFNTGQSYNLDKTQPTVSSITRSSANPSNAPTVWFAVTFSEPVTGVDTGDFALALSGINGASVVNVTGTGTTRNVEVNTGTDSGTLSLTIPATATITDPAGNSLAGLPVIPVGQDYNIYRTLPTVLSSIRASLPDPTNAASVDFTVTFSEPVTGVDTTDFIVTTTGNIASAHVTSVTDTGTGATYTVAVNTGVNSGTLRLDLMDNNSIKNALAVPLGGTGVNNYTAGEFYTIDKTPPVVLSITRASVNNPTNAASVDFTVTFSEPVTGVDTTLLSDFALTLNGVSGASVTAVSGSLTTYTVTVNTGTGSGTIRLDLIDNDTIVDALGNPFGGVGANNYILGQSYTIDKTPPAVLSITRASTDPTNAASVNYTVTFSEAVTGVDPADFAPTLAGASVTNVASVGTAQTTYTVTVNTGTGSGALGLNMPETAIVADLVGNALPIGTSLGTLPFTTGEVYAIDKIAPTVVSIVRASTVNPTGAVTLDYTVTFSEPVTGVDKTDFTPTVTGLITGASVASVNGSGTTYTVTVNNGSARGTVRLDMPDTAAIADLSGNSLAVGTLPGNLPFTAGEFYTTLPIMGIGTYDDVDTAWTYTGNWSTYTGNGPVNNTLHYTNANNTSATFVFQAPARFILTYRAGSNRGNVLVSVDGGVPFTINANNATTLWQRPYSSALYTDTGRHTVTITAPGTYIDVDTVQIVAADTPVSLGTYDDAEAAWTYTGNWSTYTGNGPLNNTLHYTNANNATATLTFQGPARFILTYRAGSNRGNIQVSVDGGVPFTINANNATTLWQQIYSKAPFSEAGIHTVTFSTPGNGSYIDMDAIRFVSPTTPMGTGIYDDTDAAWSYSGVWGTSSGTGPYANTVHYTDTVDSIASFIFQTPGRFILYYTASSSRGSFEVWVNGALLTTINAYSPTTRWQQTYISPSYADNVGRTVMIKKIGAARADVDAIRVIEAAGTGTYDDLDSGWVYNGSFTTGTSTGANGGGIHYSTTSGDSAEFAFTGSQINLVYTGNTNRAKVDVYIDNVRVATLNEYNATRVAQMKWPSGYLGSGMHTVKFVHAGPAGSIMDIDAIIVGTYQVLGTGTHDDTLPSWSYNGSFTTGTATGANGGAIHYSTTSGDSAEVTITGSQFNLVYTGNTNRAKVDVYIDNVWVATLNEYNATRVAQMKWPSGNLIPGQHTVKFVHAGPAGSVMDIDAIEVSP